MTCDCVYSPELLLADSRVLSSRLCSRLQHSCTGFECLCQALSAGKNALCMPAGVDESVDVFRRTCLVLSRKKQSCTRQRLQQSELQFLRDTLLVQLKRNDLPHKQRLLGQCY